MTEQAYDQWRDRDLRVLRTLVAKIDPEPRGRRPLTVGDVAMLVQDNHTSTGELLPDWWTGNDTVRQAIHALRRGGYIVAEDGPAEFAMGVEETYTLDITAKAYEATGAWPSAEDMATKLIAALEDLAEYSTDPVEKSRAKKAAEVLGSFSRDTLVSVIGAAAGVAMQ